MARQSTQVNTFLSKPKPTADSIAAENIRKEEQRYQDIYRPVNQELIAELGRNSLLEAAETEAANFESSEKALGRVSRELGRRGTQITGQQAQRFNDAKALTNAQDTSFLLDNARVNQRQFNDNLRAELINVGRGISKSGSNGLQEAANYEAQRNAANENARAQAKAGQYQAIGTALGLAAMVFL